MNWKSKLEVKEYHRVWREKNKDKKKAQDKAWIKRNIEKHREYRKNYLRTWRKANPERAKEILRRSWKKNGKKYNARAKELHQLNPEKRRIRDIKYRNRHREQVRANKSRYRNIRRVKILDNKLEDTRKRYKELQNETICFWCAKNINEKLHIDHVIPLKLGGKEENKNLVASCEKCNLYKGYLHPEIWVNKLLEKKTISKYRAKKLIDFLDNTYVLDTP